MNQNKEALSESEIEEFEKFIKETYPIGTQKISLSTDHQTFIYDNGVKCLVGILKWPIKFLNLSMYKISNEGMQELIRNGSNWPTL